MTCKLCGGTLLLPRKSRWSTQRQLGGKTTHIETKVWVCAVCNKSHASRDGRKERFSDDLKRLVVDEFRAAKCSPKWFSPITKKLTGWSICHSLITNWDYELEEN